MQLDGYTLAAKMRKVRRRSPLTSTEQALFYELVALCNEDDWGDNFCAASAELCHNLSITENTLNKSRERLIQVGLISYKSGKSKRQFSQYSFTTVSKFEVDVGGDKGGDESTVEGGDKLGTVSKFEDYNKQKKKKSKKTTNNISANADLKNNPFWKKFVETWFLFYKQKFVISPTFNGQAAKSLKMICDRLEKLAKETGHNWSEEYAVRCLNKFLENAYGDEWLKSNFLLSNLYSKFDSIIQKNGTGKTGNQGVGNSVKSLLSGADW